MSGEYLGDFVGDETIPFIFDSFDSNGASVTLTGLAITDIEIYKGTSMTQRASDSGYVLIDTDGIDIDTRTGIHGFSIDLSDNTDASFYATGNDFNVIVDAVTIDGQTVRFKAFSFSIQNRFMRGTDIGSLNNLSLADIFTYVIENSLTFEEVQRLQLAESAGKVSVVGATVTFRNTADDTDRIVATTDSTGQRTVVVLNAS